MCLKSDVIGGSQGLEWFMAACCKKAPGHVPTRLCSHFLFKLTCPPSPISYFLFTFQFLGPTRCLPKLICWPTQRYRLVPLLILMRNATLGFASRDSSDGILIRKCDDFPWYVCAPAEVNDYVRPSILSFITIASHVELFADMYRLRKKNICFVCARLVQDSTLRSYRICGGLLRLLRGRTTRMRLL